MELPLCLLNIEDGVIVDVNETFNKTINKLYNDYEKIDVIGKNVKSIFRLVNGEYNVMSIKNYRLYVSITTINNIIALCCCIDNDTIDSNYFIHSTLTPLSNVVELVKMIDKSGISRKQKEFVSIIKKNNFELIKNINDITNFLTYFNKGLILFKERIDLSKKIENVVNIISNVYKISITSDVNNQLIIGDNMIIFEIIYHIFFWFSQNIQEDIIHISCNGKTLDFYCESFTDCFIKNLDDCIVEKYNYSNSLDLHIIKILCILSDTRVYYTNKTYSLNIIRL